MFKFLEINQWRQYERVEIEFHDHLTIITGANGSGKTTLLNLLGMHFNYNWNNTFIGTPKRNKSTGVMSYMIGRRSVRSNGFAEKADQTSDPSVTVDIGTIGYLDGNTSSLQVPSEGGAVYNVNSLNRRNVDGLQIQSHRPIYSYSGVASIPTVALSRGQFYQEYFQTTLNRYLGHQQPKSPLQVIKEALISLAVFGAGNEYVISDNKAKETFDGFQRVLAAILPSTIGFKRISVQVPEVILETTSGDFAIDAVSGGVSSIIDMAWRILNYSPQGQRFVCVIDEPENHLHPELQQALLPNLIQAFPHVQFIIATHSPFMISAAYDSSVYALDYNSERKVVCQKLDNIDKAGTANEILRDVLGLPFTMPLWAGKKMEAIIQKYASRGVDSTALSELEAELAAAGLDTLIPDLPIAHATGASN